MEKQASNLERIPLPTRIVVNRMNLTAEDLARLLRAGELTADGDPGCELEVGGQIVARGRMVRRRGGWYFKVLRMKGEEA